MTERNILVVSFDEREGRELAIQLNRATRLGRSGPRRNRRVRSVCFKPARGMQSLWMVLSRG